MDRVGRIEGRLDALEELRPNGASSIKDQVGRIAQATGADQARAVARAAAAAGTAYSPSPNRTQEGPRPCRP
ncbi:hypothetical protein [Salinispora arenicola]|uniref:hypothetical protein n=1 Tax=Salinispora arenicola TaxID=168697 RepID=UPI000377358D